MTKAFDEKVTVLASGGVDSTAVIDFYLRRSKRVECIHFQYGQSSALSEKQSFEKVVNFYNVNGRTVNLGFSLNKRQEEVTGRNALFVLIASAVTQNPSRIALGIHKGSPFYDCTEAFVKECQRVLDGYFSGTVRLEAPFLDMTKQEIVRYSREFSVPLDLTYSCQKQDFPPCLVCSSCIDRKTLLGE